MINNFKDFLNHYLDSILLFLLTWRISDYFFDMLLDIQTDCVWSSRGKVTIQSFDALVIYLFSQFLTVCGLRFKIFEISDTVLPSLLIRTIKAFSESFEDACLLNDSRRFCCSLLNRIFIMFSSSCFLKNKQVKGC